MCLHPPSVSSPVTPSSQTHERTDRRPHVSFMFPLLPPGGRGFCLLFLHIKLFSLISVLQSVCLSVSMWPSSCLQAHTGVTPPATSSRRIRGVDPHPPPGQKHEGVSYCCVFPFLCLCLSPAFGEVFLLSAPSSCLTEMSFSRPHLPNRCSPLTPPPPAACCP